VFAAIHQSPDVPTYNHYGNLHVTPGAHCAPLQPTWVFHRRRFKNRGRAMRAPTQTRLFLRTRIWPRTNTVSPTIN